MVAPNQSGSNATVVSIAKARSQSQQWPNPNEPMKVARHFLANLERRGHPLRWHDYEWIGYTKNHWKTLQDDDIRNNMYRTLENATYADEKGHPRRWKPNIKKVNEIIAALRSVAQIVTVDEGGWFDGRTDQVIPCKNGLVRVADRKLLKHSPLSFNRYVLPFNYDPAATSSLWTKYTNGAFDSQETVETVEEWIGYILSGRKDLERYLLLVGPRRAGKGTFMVVISALLPKESHIGFNAERFKRDKFAQTELIGKSLINISDSRADLSDLRFVDLLLRIVGNDEVSLRPPYGRQKDTFNGNLPGRLTVASNYLPVFPDDSQAIADRTLAIEMSNCFVGKEDHRLKAKLTRPEHLSAILNRALDGLDRLNERGRFRQPACGLELLANLRESGSPIKLFLNECCKIAPDELVLKEPLYRAYRAFCEGFGFLALDYSRFASALYAASDQKIRSGKTGGRRAQRPAFVGVGLLTTGAQP